MKNADPFSCSMTIALLQLTYPILSSLTLEDAYLAIGLAIYPHNLPLLLLLFSVTSIQPSFFLRHYHIPYTAYFSSCIYNSYTSRSAELLLISLITPRTTLLYCLLHWIAYCALHVTWLGACQAPYSEEVEKKKYSLG